MFVNDLHNLFILGLLLQKYLRSGSKQLTFISLDLEGWGEKIKVWQSWSLVKSSRLWTQHGHMEREGGEGRKRGERRRGENERKLLKALSSTITLGTRVSTQGFLRKHIYAVHNKLSEAWRIGSIAQTQSLRKMHWSAECWISELGEEPQNWDS